MLQARIVAGAWRRSCGRVSFKREPRLRLEHGLAIVGCGESRAIIIVRMTTPPLRFPAPAVPALQATLRRAAACASLAPCRPRRLRRVRRRGAARRATPAARRRTAAPSQAASIRASRNCCRPTRTTRRSDVTSDTGELGRDGDADPERQRARSAWASACSLPTRPTINAEQRSVAAQGRRRIPRPAAARARQGRLVPAKAACGDVRGRRIRTARPARCAARRRTPRLAPTGHIELEGVRYTACPPGNEDWSLAAGAIDHRPEERRSAPGRDVRARIPRRADPLHAVDLVSGRRPAQVGPAVPDHRQQQPHRHAGRGAVLLEPRAELRRHAHQRWYSSRGVRLDPELRYLERATRAASSTSSTWCTTSETRRGPQRRRLAARHALRTAHAAAGRRRQRQRQRLFRGFRCRLRRHERHLRRIATSNCGTTWRLVVQRPRAGLPGHRPRTRWTPRRAVPHRAAADGARALARPARAACRARCSPRPPTSSATLRPAGRPARCRAALEWRVDRNGAFVAAGASYRYTQYMLDDVAPRRRRFAQTARCRRRSLDAGFTLERASGSQGQPHADARAADAVPVRAVSSNQDDLPVFDTGIPDLNLVQLFRTNRYVGPDRVGDANQVSVGVTTRLLDCEPRPPVPERDARPGVLLRGPARARCRTSRCATARRPTSSPSSNSPRSRTGTRALPTSGTRTRPRASAPRPSCSTTRRRAGSSTPATVSGATCSSRSTCRAPGRSTTSGAASRAVVYSLQRGQDARPVRGRRILLVLLGRAPDHAALRLQPHGRRRHVVRPAAGTEGFVQCRSRQRSFPARSDSGILRAPVRAPTLRCP